jgi:Carboxypeptidase regulatory-like domain
VGGGRDTPTAVVVGRCIASPECPRSGAALRRGNLIRLQLQRSAEFLVSILIESPTYMKARFLTLLLFCASAMLAQDFRATLQGTISDPSNATIAGSTVTLRSVETGVERNTVANSSGYYLFQYLPIGNYVLNVSAPGFRNFVRENIRLEVGANVRVDVTMQLGDAAQTVEVTAEVSGVQTDSSDLSTSVPGGLKDNLPLKGRSSLFMFSLAPGIVGNRYAEDTRPNDTATNVSFSANGAPNTSNDVSVDGVINTVNVNRGLSIAAWVPAVDSISEFKLQTGSLSSEYGRSGGAIANMVVKSGTNALHGSLYYFHQNSALNANNFFSRGRGQDLAAFASNNWGTAIGGPVYIPKLYNGQNRTFWFASYEASREGVGAAHTSSVPTAKMRAGDFSEVAATIYDPFSVRMVNGVPTRDPFPNNIIPLNRQDPVARNLINLLPEANTPSNSATQPWVQNFTFSYKWPRNFDMYAFKFDHLFSEKYSTFFRLNTGEGFFNFPYQFEGIGTPGRNVVTRPHRGFAWGNSFLLSAATTLDVRLGYANGIERNRPWSDGFDLASVGFSPEYLNLVQSAAVPTISLAGFQSLAGSPYIENAGHTWSLQSNVSQVRGKHLLKVGADLRLLYGNFFGNNHPSGSFSFNNAWTDGPRADTPTSGTGFPVASFLLGLGSGSLATETGLSILNKYSAFFIQDDFRATRKLTLNLGLRYEYETPRTERYNRTTRGFAYNAPSPIQVPGMDLHGGLLFAGENGLPRGLYNPDRNNFAPRVGFAYNIMDKTVLRGGYALHYIPTVGSVEPTGFSVTTPFVVSQDGITPNDRLSNPFPGGLLQPIGSSQGLATLAGQNVSFVDPGDRTSSIHTWNFNIQREIFPSSVLQVGYVGSRGLNLVPGGQWSTGDPEQLNQLDPSYLSQGASLLQTVENPFFGLFTSGPLAGPRVQRQQLLRPYPQFGNVTRLYGAYGNSIYHALQSKLETRLRNGITTLITYTWSKNISDIARIQNHYDRQSARSLGQFDVPHRLTITGSAEIPVGRGRKFLTDTHRALDYVVGGWTVSTFSTFQSGFPLEYSLARPNIFAAGTGPQFPDVTGDPTAGITGSHQERLNRYFNTDAFAQPEDFTFGNAGARIGSVRSPGMNNVNLTLTKDFAVKEGMLFRLRASSFNLMNTPVFAAPNTQFGTGNFGVVFNQNNASRQTELALRLVF